ncbi:MULTISPECIES: hypothetical protein [Desulfitobacterium]|uniref:Uncharacterized protein n=1 Tax=Desulfitobacterium chlororespirans DSM 11544 TaxID=1121395 RepID=A0A1M7T6P4_9FIRM|nr:MULTISPECIES: hypothetical protein [Desulfitobacterium]SHN66365.1 hypothetical protein SAMN02745215_01663 [Desulfitobacterium chlororespirans DSM 11544]
MLKKVGNWLRNEDGFEVFEKFGLTQGGVLLALGVTAVGVFFMSSLWSSAGDSLGGVADFSPSNIGDYQSQGWIQ